MITIALVVLIAITTIVIAVVAGMIERVHGPLGARTRRLLVVYTVNMVVPPAALAAFIYPR